eukprot:CAMPEP_0201539274 /NCGR_PEP_ID=MMETSP0161_2-20130828/69976_1 /ASSEMBLY_ACC=CAM_ASM_000251 /TAXON_ID=180227 /ORGANISM="Neoparamoeba aestuarina, Strain SoJaBio B1-5/56/2" /LENGTH=179 /DNA_ID=CAMNT_0047946571 /DNA_START=177 /DNA_END=713 /DNA_ORIENTATION=+
MTALADQLNSQLTQKSIRSQVDGRSNVSVGWKFNNWELKGVPLRVEVGPKEVDGDTVPVVERFTGEKRAVAKENFGDTIQSLLDGIHQKMLQSAREKNTEKMHLVRSWDDFMNTVTAGGFPLAPFCGAPACEDRIKKESAECAKEAVTDVKAPSMGAKSLCIPLDQPDECLGKCILPTC